MIPRLVQLDCWHLSCSVSSRLRLSCCFVIHLSIWHNLINKWHWVTHSLRWFINWFIEMVWWSIENWINLNQLSSELQKISWFSRVQRLWQWSACPSKSGGPIAVAQPSDPWPQPAIDRTSLIIHGLSFGADRAMTEKSWAATLWNFRTHHRLGGLQFLCDMKNVSRSYHIQSSPCHHAGIRGINVCQHAHSVNLGLIHKGCCLGLQSWS